MESPEALIKEFLDGKNIAVTGVSSRSGPANHITKKLMGAGYTVYPVNPKMSDFEGVPCHASVSEIGVVPDGVVIVNKPEVTLKITEECIRMGVPMIWMHNMMGIVGPDGKPGEASSVSNEAVEKAREAGIKVISGSCPMQFIPPVDIFHRCVLWISRKTGKMG